MIKKILIANRGEIACRIIKTADRLGIVTVAVYSDADSQALHTQMASETVHIGPAPSQQSYLCVEKIIQAALATGADAIHPGYGFLSENSGLAQACDDNNIIFIGPSVTAIEAMGSKSAAKNIMSGANVPLIPGYHGEDQSLERFSRESELIGYPVLLKAASGGGGKGMRVVNTKQELQSAYGGAKREALSSFNDDTLLVEKYLAKPRHIEVQIFADQLGNTVYLFERDCSLQRRHQKIVEEAPAPNITSNIREALGHAAVKAAQAIDYVGAGTVEFLFENGAFFFMEMNTRLQVEHPVTEFITDLDLVEWQILVANGEPLPLQQSELAIDGHAVEVRIYAEAPLQNFLPSTGDIDYLAEPAVNEAVRLDTGIQEGDTVSMYYDPMLAKLITWGENRTQAIENMQTALRDYQIIGVNNNIAFLSKVLKHRDFIEAHINTRFIESNMDELLQEQQYSTAGIVASAAMLYHLDLPHCHVHSSHSDDKTLDSQTVQLDPWLINSGWRIDGTRQYHYLFEHEDKLYHCNLSETESETTIAISSDNTILLEATIDIEFINDRTVVNLTTGNDPKQHKELEWDAIQLNDDYHLLSGLQHYVVKSGIQHIEQDNSHKDNSAAAPMTGTVVSVMVNKGQAVKLGEPLAIIEAMKMEHTVNANRAGIVDTIHYQVGDIVKEGKELISLADNA